MQCPFIHHKWALNWNNEVESAGKAIIVLSNGEFKIGLKKSLKTFDFQLNVEDIDKDLKILNTRNDFLHGQALTLRNLVRTDLLIGTIRIYIIQPCGSTLCLIC